MIIPPCPPSLSSGPVYFWLAAVCVRALTLARARGAALFPSAHARRKFAKQETRGNAFGIFARCVVVKAPKLGHGEGRAGGRAGTGRSGVCASEELGCTQHQNRSRSRRPRRRDESVPCATRKQLRGPRRAAEAPFCSPARCGTKKLKEAEGPRGDDLERLRIHADPGGPR